MRIIGWLLAAVLIVIGFVSSTNAQNAATEKKSAAKVYASSKKAPGKRAARMEARQDEPAYGSQDWWRLKAERFTNGDGGGSP